MRKITCAVLFAIFLDSSNKTEIVVTQDIDPSIPQSDTVDEVISAVLKIPEEKPRPHVLISFFETKYAYMGNRGKNIEKASIKTITIKSEETWSFNSTVGPRTVENGFLRAPIIFKGELIDGEGGGVCQVSSTIHGVARRAGLEIIERTPHSRPSSYIQLGMDSTVVWPDTDLKIKNTFSYPIEIRMFSSSSKILGEKILRAEIWGVGDLIPTPVYKFSSAKREPFERIVRRPVKGTPDSVKRIQKGHSGQEVTSKLSWADGKTQIWKSIYPPTNEIWEVGESVAPDLDLWSPDSDSPKKIEEVATF